MHQKHPPANVAFASSARTTEAVKAPMRPASSSRRGSPEARLLTTHSFVALRRRLPGHAVPDPAAGDDAARGIPVDPCDGPAVTGVAPPRIPSQCEEEPCVDN